MLIYTVVVLTINICADFLLVSYYSMVDVLVIIFIIIIIIIIYYSLLRYKLKITNIVKKTCSNFAYVSSPGSRNFPKS